MTVGLLFFDDLNAFARWHAGVGRAWAPERPRGRLRPPTVHPPPHLVVVARAVMWDRLVVSAGWLGLARRIAVVLDASDEPERVTDPDLAQLAAMEEAELRAALSCPLTVDVVLDPGALDGAIDRALQTVAGDAPWPSWRPAVPREPFAPGPWIDWSAPFWHHEHPPDLDACRAHLAAQLCLRGGRPTLLDSIHGARIDLLDGTRTPAPALEDAGNAWQPVAARPDAPGWLRRHPASERRSGWTWSVGAGPRQTGGYGRPIGIDPTEQVAWTGGRCRFDWRVMTARGPAWWTFSDHDWPAGHGKKLYGYEDNDPQWVHLSPDAEACLSVYDHDALVTPGLPLRWREVGDVFVAERTVGLPRALLFARELGDDAYPADPASADEDARDRAPTVTLGPDAQRRYVVGFDAPVWRVVGEGAIPLDPAGAGWVVYDAEHRPVRYGAGRLLAGWHRWAVVLDGDRLLRHDLVTEAVEPLGPVDGQVTAAVALPGTPNILLLELVDDVARVRLA